MRYIRNPIIPLLMPELKNIFHVLMIRNLVVGNNNIWQIVWKLHLIPPQLFSQAHKEYLPSLLSSSSLFLCLGVNGLQQLPFVQNLYLYLIYPAYYYLPIHIYTKIDITHQNFKISDSLIKVYQTGHMKYYWLKKSMLCNTLWQVKGIRIFHVHIYTII